MEMNNCALCYNGTKLWAVSSCEHSICLLCSARLRVLCKQRDCPQCREIQEEVCTTEKVLRAVDNFPLRLSLVFLCVPR